MNNFKKAMIHGDPRAMLDELARGNPPKKLFKGKGKIMKQKQWGG